MDKKKKKEGFFTICKQTFGDEGGLAIVMSL